MNISTICKYILFAAFILAFIGCTQPIEVENEVPIVTGSVTLSINADIPLVAYYNRDSVNTIPVTVRVKGKTEDMDIAHTYDAGYGKEFPIFGLYPDYENTIEITESGVTKSFEVRTSPLPEGAPINTAVTDNLSYAPDAFNQDLYWVHAQPNTIGTIVYDRKGDTRYYYYTTKELSRVVKKDGEIYLEDDYGVITIEGKSIFTPSEDIAYHHDMIEMSNGNYVILADSEWGLEDRVIEQTSGGSVVKDKTFGSLFRDIVNISNGATESDLDTLNKIIYDDENIYTNADTNHGDLNVNGIRDNGEENIDWAHANSLVYDEDSDIMYFSLRNQGVIAVDWSEWKLLWWMADNTLDTIHHGVPNRGENLLKIEDLKPYRVLGAAATSGPKNQHALFLHENGNLGMFDNAGDEQESTEGSRYVEYKIVGEEGNFEANIENEYRDNSLYSRITSDIDFTGESNLLMLWGQEWVVREIDLEMPGQKVFELIVEQPRPSVAYRVDKMPLYPYQDTNKKYSIDYNEEKGT